MYYHCWTDSHLHTHTRIALTIDRTTASPRGDDIVSIVCTHSVQHVDGGDELTPNPFESHSVHLPIYDEITYTQPNRHRYTHLSPIYARTLTPHWIGSVVLCHLHAERCSTYRCSLRPTRHSLPLTPPCPLRRRYSYEFFSEGFLVNVSIERYVSVCRCDDGCARIATHTACVCVHVALTLRTCLSLLFIHLDFVIGSLCNIAGALWRYTQTHSNSYKRRRST